MRAVADRETIVRLYVDDEGGRLTAADATPTVSVTDGDGTAVTGVSAVSEEDTGVYKATIPARSTLDRLTVTWTATVGGFSRTVRSYVDLQRERLVPLWQLREDEEMADLSDASLWRVVDAVEAWFTRALGFPPILVGKREKWRQAPTLGLMIPDVTYLSEVYSLTYDDGSNDPVAVDAADYEITEDRLYLLGNMSFLTGLSAKQGWDAGTYEAHVAHVLALPEEDLRRAGATFGRYISRTSNYPERARRIVSAETEIVFSMPSPDAPTGLPEVDAVVRSMSARSIF